MSDEDAKKLVLVGPPEGASLVAAIAATLGDRVDRAILLAPIETDPPLTLQAFRWPPELGTFERSLSSFVVRVGEAAAEMERVRKAADEFAAIIAGMDTTLAILCRRGRLTRRRPSKGARIHLRRVKAQARR